ncbi:MAG: hypothetical protein ACLFVU_15215 [Phycisphaerae bacterium]
MLGADVSTWNWREWTIFLLPFVLLIVVGVLAYLLKGTIRSRLEMGRQLREDPDINEWLICFNWSRKILYIPTIVVSVVAGTIMLFEPGDQAAYIIGGVWLGMFFLNFLVDEYEMSVKVLLIFFLLGVVLFLWLAFLDWEAGFVGVFSRIRVIMSPTVYYLIALIFTLAIVVSWIRGLFYYVAITPNYLNVQVGTTETGEQVSREEYSTRIDTGDFLERLLGFGRIIITFADQRRQPMVLLVWGIGNKASRLESIRGKLAVDRHQAGRIPPEQPF